MIHRADLGRPLQIKTVLGCCKRRRDEEGVYNVRQRRLQMSHGPFSKGEILNKMGITGFAVSVVPVSSALR